MVSLKRSKLFSKLNLSPSSSSDSISKKDIKVLHKSSSALSFTPPTISIASPSSSTNSPKRKSNKCKSCDKLLDDDTIFLNCGDNYHETCHAMLYQAEKPLCACGEPLVLKQADSQPQSAANSHSNSLDLIDDSQIDDDSNLSIPSRLSHRYKSSSFFEKTPVSTPLSTPVIPSSPFISNSSTISHVYVPQVKFNQKLDNLINVSINNPIIYNDVGLPVYKRLADEDKLLNGLKIDLHSGDQSLEFSTKLSNFAKSISSINNSNTDGISSLNLGGKLLPPNKIDDPDAYVEDTFDIHDQISNETEKTSIELPITPKTHAANFYPTPSKTPLLADKYSSEEIIQQFVNNLTKIENWFDYIDEDTLGKLLFFDYLNISTNGLDWDLILCVLFENNILMINDNKLIGIIGTHDLIKINRQENMLTLLMINDLLPELQISQQELIIVKWEYYLNQLICKNEVNVNLIQLTTNAWDQIPANILPPDVQNFLRIIKENKTIPTNYLVQSLPKPEILPLNLILSVCVINHNSGLTNEQYRGQIINTINTIRSNLRAIDQLGLIFIGTDGSKYCYNKGSFIGCVSSTWDGWDGILKDIQIYDNDDCVTSNLQEFQLVFEKIFDIYPFIPHKNHINKVMILNMNNFDDEIVNNDLLIRRISTLEKLSITLIRIGHENQSVQYINQLITRPTKDLKIIYGDNLLRFQNLDNFLITLPELIENYQNIIIPTLSINIQGSIVKLEINGKLVDVDTKNKSPPSSPLLSLHQDNITLLIKDIIPQQVRNIDIIGSGTIHYTTRWLNSKIQNTVQV